MGRRNEYRSWNRKMRDLDKEIKVRVDEEFGRKPCCFGERLIEREEGGEP